MKVFIDSDVILDFLLSREPFLNDVVELFLLKDKRNLKFFTSAIIISNVYYISRQHFPKQIIIDKLKDLSLVIDIVDSTKSAIINGYNSDFSDFEDAVQYYTAIENKCAFLITRNVKDFKKAKNIRVLSASQFCKLFV